MSYLPEVAWSTIASNVTLGASAYRYYITVNPLDPLDPNEAGASPMTVAINDWFIDFAGYPFLIEEVNGSILTVYDILERGDGTTSAYGPYANQLGYVYRPLNGAIILTQAQLRKLDESAKDIIQPIEKGIQWAYRGIRLVSVDDDYSNITRLDLTNNLKYTYTENGGWQGGHKAELDLNIGLGTGALAEMEYTNNGDGTITVQDNTFMLYDNANGTGYPKPYLIPGGTFSFTDNIYNYVVADYNSGTPIMYVITDVTLINETTIVPVFSVLRRGTILCLTNWNTLGNAKIDKLHQSIVKTQRYRRQSGLAISVPSTGTPRRVSITGGIVWIGAVPVDLNATISGDAGVYMFEYYKSSSTWTYTLVSQINNTYYQGTTDRVELTSNRYAVAFIFRGVEHYNNHIYLVYGTGDYTLAQAQASGQPSDLPVAINSHAILVGRVIIQKSSDTITEIASAFDKAFLIQPVGDHAGLSNLGWTVSGHTGTAGSVPVFNSSGVASEASLTNGYIPYKTASGLGNSPIFIDGVNIGFGTTTPQTSFHFYESTSTEICRFQNTDTILKIGFDLYGGEVGIYTSDDTLIAGHVIENTDTIMLGQNILYAVNSTKRIGIKTATPKYDFDLNGTARIGTLNGLIKGTSGVLSAITSTESGTKYLRDDYTWQTVTEGYWSQNGTSIYYNTGNVGIGTTSPSVKLDVSGTGRFTDKLYLGTTTAPATDTGTLNSLVWDSSTGEVKQRSISGSLPSGTQGDILYHNGTTWTVLNAGTNGYYLKTQGSGANPIWDNPSTSTSTFLKFASYYTDVSTSGTTETTLYSITLSSGFLNTNGDTIEGKYYIFGNSITDATINLYIFGQSISFGTVNLGSSLAILNVTIIRVSNTTIRIGTKLSYSNAPYNRQNYVEKTGLDLGETGYDIILKGRAPTSGSLTAKEGYLLKYIT